MDTTISIKTIEAIDAFKNLSKVQQSFCLKRSNRLLLTNALIVHKNTGVIPSNVSGYNSLLLGDLILGESAKFDKPIHFENPPTIKKDFFELKSE
jgi:hypothetical protein